MTELRWVLLGIAAVLLVALFLYGKWQERSSSQRDGSMPGRPDEAPDRPLPPSPRATAARNTRQAPARIEPTMGISPDAGPSSHDPDEPAISTVDGWIEDALLDVMLELRCNHAFDGVAALEARAQLDRLALPLPTHLAVWDSKAARWSAPDRFGFYSEMLIAVQLASRRHLLGEIDASRFVSAVQQIAVSIDADFDPPDVARLVQQAAQLDRLCAKFDVRITLTLEAQAAQWSNDTVAAAAAEAGLTQVDPARWQRGDTERSAEHPAAISMTAPSWPAPRLALVLDVPRATANPPPLSILFTMAQQLAGRLNASVVDDNGRAIEPAAQSAIEIELDQLIGDMRAAGIEPGSARAQRLYTD